MKSLIGAILVGAALVLAWPAAISPAGAAPQANAQTAGTFDANSRTRRFYRHHGNRAYHQPRYYSYYDRPRYYRPYPYSVPAPFTFGFAFDPPWW